MPEIFNGEAPSPFIPGADRFYERIGMPLTWVLLRVSVGGALVIEGWPKIMAPLAQSGFLEGIGFHPGWLWSPLLAVLQVFGGLAIAIGLLTRPAALANSVMLAITPWFHVTHPFGDAFLTGAGVAALNADQGVLFTAEGAQWLAKGGGEFLTLMQRKAELLSALWMLATLLFAGFGGGPCSVDRNLLRKEF